MHLFKLASICINLQCEGILSKGVCPIISSLPNEKHIFFFRSVLMWLYAVKVQRSLAPLSWFPGSRKPTAHVHQCCRFQSYAKSRRLHAITNEIYKQSLHCVNHIPGIHDNGPPWTTLWRLTLTAYCWIAVPEHNWIFSVIIYALVWLIIVLVLPAWTLMFFSNIF